MKSDCDVLQNNEKEEEQQQEQYYDEASLLQELRDISNRRSDHFYESVILHKHKHKHKHTHKPIHHNSMVKDATFSCSLQSSSSSSSSLSLPLSHQDHENNNNINDNDCKDSFLESQQEKAHLNQYWYSQHTIHILCQCIQEILQSNTNYTHPNNKNDNNNNENENDDENDNENDNENDDAEIRVAFLSTPSLYFSIPLPFRKHCFLFEVSILFMEVNVLWRCIYYVFSSSFLAFEHVSLNAI